MTPPTGRPGDPVATDPDALYERYWPRLRAFAASRFGARDADDIAQETLARCYERSAGIDRRGDLWPWLRTVAHNVGCDLARQRARHVPVSAETMEILYGASGDDTAAAAISGAEARILDAALARLPASDWLVLRLRDVDELGYDSIGRLLGVTANAARQRAFRARVRLRRLYADVEAGLRRAVARAGGAVARPRRNRGHRHRRGAGGAPRPLAERA